MSPQIEALLAQLKEECKKETCSLLAIVGEEQPDGGHDVKIILIGDRIKAGATVASACNREPQIAELLHAALVTSTLI